MANESTKAAIQQLEGAGFDTPAAKLKHLVIEIEHTGAECSVGFVEWRPELGHAQILVRLSNLKPEKEAQPSHKPETAAPAAASTSAEASRRSAPTASSSRSSRSARS